jgi:quercetin dioxygenase-like cupin family protein
MTETSESPVRLQSVANSFPEPGLTRQVLAWNPQMMLVRHVMEPGWKGARHSHPHEQMVYVIRGKLRFICGDRSFEAGPGDSFIVPGGVEHEAAALEPSEVLDFFVPFREDYV